jgi:hypothetical protein
MQPLHTRRINSFPEPSVELIGLATKVVKNVFKPQWGMRVHRKLVMINGIRNLISGIECFHVKNL